MGNYLYVSGLVNESTTLFNNYINRVYEILSFLKKDYPDFAQWYWKKVVPDVSSAKREIIIKEIGNEIAAIVILKKHEELKICSFIVLPQYQNKGIGKELLELSMNILGTDKPVITVSSHRIDEFESLLSSYNFRVCEKLDDYYLNGFSEYVFNGYLSNIYESNKKSFKTA